MLPNLAETYYYRTASGAECDLVIKMPNSEFWAVEIKYGSAHHLGKHYRQTFEDIGAAEKFVIYSGVDEFPVGNDVTVISLARFMERLHIINPSSG